MKLFKYSTLILCMTVAGCSTFSHDKQPAEAQAQNSGTHHWWWPFGGGEQKAEPTKVAKIDTQATQAWLDQYEPRLREAVKGSRMEVERRDNVLVVTAPVDGSFNPDRPSMLLPISLGPVSRVAKLVEGDAKTGVLVLGHADPSGDDAKNRQLSQERAQAVAAIFRLSGLQRDRLSLKGVGSDMPRAANDSKDGRALNRRVEIVLTPQDTLVALLARYNQPPKVAQQAVAADQGK
ncbi:OmpA family protein [Pseudomonas otitidis]|nr:OmpA family protein [Pseudomonas otitidis]MCO7554268.1 OmpA family protein [Pseudomonas otitidis]